MKWPSWLLWWVARTAYVETCNKITHKENHGAILSLTLSAFYFLINHYKQGKGSSSGNRCLSFKIFILSFRLNRSTKKKNQRSLEFLSSSEGILTTWYFRFLNNSIGTYHVAFSITIPLQQQLIIAYKLESIKNLQKKTL